MSSVYSEECYRLHAITSYNYITVHNIQTPAAGSAEQRCRGGPRRAEQSYNLSNQLQRSKNHSSRSSCDIPHVNIGYSEAWLQQTRSVDIVSSEIQISSYPVSIDLDGDGMEVTCGGAGEG